MANRTQTGALSVHGTDPQNLVEKIVRSRIHQAKYWNEDCFGLDVATLTDKAMALREIGGTYGGNYKATPFLCLVLKMLQLAPPKEIGVELINAEEHKYMRCLGAFYLRMTGKPTDVYVYLEALYNDFRKIRWRSTSGSLEVIRVDEFIDRLLTEERVCDIILPRIMARHTLEELEELPRRVSALEEMLESSGSNSESEESGPNNEAEIKKRKRSRSESRERSRSVSREKRTQDRPRDKREQQKQQSFDNSIDRDYDGHRNDRERDNGTDRERSRREKVRAHDRDSARERERDHGYEWDRDRYRGRDDRDYDRNRRDYRDRDYRDRDYRDRYRERDRRDDYRDRDYERSSDKRRGRRYEEDRRKGDDRGRIEAKPSQSRSRSRNHDRKNVSRSPSVEKGERSPSPTYVRRPVRKAYKPLTKKDKQRKQKEAETAMTKTTVSKASDDHDEGMTIDETNKLRLELGLKPLAK